MLKKRLMGVVTVKNGWAVQSFGYRRYLPLGKPECLVENLDRWGADEILVQVIDRSVDGLGPDFKLLERLGSIGLETPLVYAGGVRSVSDGIELIHLGADRLVVDALLHDDLSSVHRLSEQLGAQALIGSMPLSLKGNGVEWLDYRNKMLTPLTDEMLGLIQSCIISEVLITDWMHEGYPNKFEKKLVEKFPLRDAPIIVFGGISEPAQMSELFQLPCVAAVAIGNFLAYREHAIQKYKEGLQGMPIRASVYESRYPLTAND